MVASLASQVLGNMNRDERIVRGLLDTKLDSVPKRLLVVASPFVLKKACARLKHTHSFGRVTSGLYRGSQIGVVDTGMGTPSAAMMMEAIVRTKPILVVRADVCGGLGPSQKVGDTFIANRAIAGDGCCSMYFGAGTQVTSEVRLTDYVAAQAEKQGLTVHVGVIWTTDILLTQTRELLNNWISKGADAVDMESSAILGIAASAGIPAASLNCISDLPAAGAGPFDSGGMEPAFFSGIDAVVDVGLTCVASWQNE